MAIKHVVTGGYGFADGTIYIPTHGFTPAVEVVYPAVTIPVRARSLTVLVPDRGTTIAVAARSLTVLVPEREP